MAFSITEVQDGRVVEVELSGKLTRESYQQFVPMTEARINEFGKISMLVVLRDFHGWNAGALWEDLKFDVKHFDDIKRLAFVGEKKWQKGMASFCKPFTTAEIKYFELDELEAARAWVQA